MTISPALQIFEAGFNAGAAEAHVFIDIDRKQLEAIFNRLCLPVIGWQPMDTAPMDGTHCILAIQEGAFVWSVQGSYDGKRWNSVIGSDVKPLAWMQNILLPDHLTPEERT